jgi:hypothetical protein
VFVLLAHAGLLINGVDGVPKAEFDEAIINGDVGTSVLVGVIVDSPFIRVVRVALQLEEYVTGGGESQSVAVGGMLLFRFNLCIAGGGTRN